MLPVFVALSRFLPTYLPACYLFACLLFLPPALPFLYACSSNGGECLHEWTSAVLSQLSGASCGHILFEFGCELKLTGVISKSSRRPWVCCFPLIGYNFLLWPISAKMPSREECGWPIIGTQLLRLKPENTPPCTGLLSSVSGMSPDQSTPRWHDCRTWFRHGNAPFMIFYNSEVLFLDFYHAFSICCPSIDCKTGEQLQCWRGSSRF